MSSSWFAHSARTASALLADGQRLADAEDAAEALVQNVLQLRGHEFVRLLRRGQPKLAAALGVANQHSRHAHVLDLVDGHLARVRAAARKITILGRDLDTGLERVL